MSQHHVGVVQNHLVENSDGHAQNLPFFKPSALIRV